MAGYGEVLAALRDFRNHLSVETHDEVAAQFKQGVCLSAFTARNGVSAFAMPLSNVHATGVGLRVRNNKIVKDEYVLKVYVFDKVALGADTPHITTEFKGIGVDVEPLAIQQALPARRRAAATALAAPAIPPQRQRRRPIVGGLSIAPIGADFVGTLGCFLRRASGGSEQIFALSNNHVMAAVNQLPLGTSIVQPGSEVTPSGPGEVFAELSAFTPVQFPTGQSGPVLNQLDAATAAVADPGLVELGTIFGIKAYDPQLAAPLPGMQVTKSGRTTGVTTGIITGLHIGPVQINYGTSSSPRIATFSDAINVVGDTTAPFQCARRLGLRHRRPRYEPAGGTAVCRCPDEYDRVRPRRRVQPISGLSGLRRWSVPGLYTGFMRLLPTDIPGRPTSPQPPRRLEGLVGTLRHRDVSQVGLTTTPDGTWALLVQVKPGARTPIPEVETACGDCPVVYRSAPEEVPVARPAYPAIGE